MAQPPGPLARSNYLNWPPGPYQASADPNNAAFNPASVLPANGIVSYGDVALDSEQYHRAIERLHGSGMHGAGVAFGMKLVCQTGEPNIVIAPGLAIDAAGRHIYLATGGSAEVGATANVPNTPPDLTPVTAAGATLPTAGRTGEYYVVAQWRETWDSASYASDPNITQYNDTPWLQLVTAAGYLPDLHVVLGKVTLNSSFQVTAASYGDVGGLQRSGVSVPAQSVKLHRSVNTGSPGADTTAWGSVRAREGGGIELAVANASDQLAMLTEAGGIFSTLAVGASQANVGDLANPSIRLKGYEGTLEVGAPGNYGDVLVYDGGNHLAVSLIGDTGHVIVGGPTLNGQVRMKNANAQDTMTLDGVSGSAVVQRLKPFSSNQAIDVDALFFRIHGWDLILDGRSGGNKRALVDWNNTLRINYHGDYTNGVEIDSDLNVEGVLRDGNGTPLMGNPARKVNYAYLFTNGTPQRVMASVDLITPRQFTAYCSMIDINSTTDFDYDNEVAVEVYQVDGVTTGAWISGPKLGPPGDDKNVHQPIVTGFGRVITFRLAALGPDINAAAVGIVFYE
jgi:hypothetical protein